MATIVLNTGADVLSGVFNRDALGGESMGFEVNTLGSLKVVGCCVFSE